MPASTQEDRRNRNRTQSAPVKPDPQWLHPENSRFATGLQTPLAEPDSGRSLSPVMASPSIDAEVQARHMAAEPLEEEPSPASPLRPPLSPINQPVSNTVTFTEI